jgi:putative transposase
MNVIPNEVYFVQSIANQNQIIFHQRSDYFLFSDLFNKYLEPYCTMFCFSILDNQFQFLLQVNELGAENIMLGPLTLTRFSNGLRLLQSKYAYYRNKKYTKSGNVFKQKASVHYVDKNNLQSMHNYLEAIHHSPLDYCLTRDCCEWRYSSIHQYFETGVYEYLIKVKTQRSLLYNLVEYGYMEV